MPQPSQQAADVICGILTTIETARMRFEGAALERGITMPQLQAAAIAEALREHGLLASSRVERPRRRKRAAASADR